MRVPEVAAINDAVMSPADTCCDLISTFVSGAASVELGGLDSAFGCDETKLLA